MTLLNRLAIKERCAQIEQLVGGQDMEMGHVNGGVRIGIAGGKKAKVEEEFYNALKAYLSASRSGDGATPADKEALAMAVDDWANAMGY